MPNIQDIKDRATEADIPLRELRESVRNCLQPRVRCLQRLGYFA